MLFFVISFYDANFIVFSTERLDKSIFPLAWLMKFVFYFGRLDAQSAPLLTQMYSVCNVVPLEHRDSN